MSENQTNKDIGGQIGDIIDLIEQYFPTAKNLAKWFAGVIDTIIDQTREVVVIENITPEKLDEIRAELESLPPLPTTPDEDLM